MPCLCTQLAVQQPCAPGRTNLESQDIDLVIESTGHVPLMTSCLNFIGSYPIKKHPMWF